MWTYLFLIAVLLVCSFNFKEGFTRAGDYTADMFASNQCPCLSCVNQSYVSANKP